MRLQFGQCDLGGAPLDESALEKASEILTCHGCHSPRRYRGANVAMLYWPFPTTEEATKETQPYVLRSSAVITWDGRLDNAEDLIHELGADVADLGTDVAIAATAFERWGTDCFGKLIGDWAVAIWDARKHSVLLARDFSGIRPLYYTLEKQRLTWGTVLDPLVLLAGHPLELNEEYIAAWLSSFPDPALTPYNEIRSIPPSCFACFTDRGQYQQKYWDFDRGKRTSYPSDSEYEEHFRSFFRQAVKRRLRSNGHVIAELSGGVDSSSIVCVADDIIAKEGGPELNTLSYYDDSEPHWNERPYFSLVEKKRGHTGHHINIQGSNDWQPFDSDAPVAWTPAFAGKPTDVQKQFTDALGAERSRVLLSGIGGDEVLGGVPNALPELADLLVRGQLGPFAHQLKAWSLSLRRAWIHLFRDTVLLFMPPALRRQELAKMSDWLTADFTKRFKFALIGYTSRLRPFAALPSFQANLSTLDALRRQLACLTPPTDLPHEYRYPYLDRDLLEFLFSIPREQLVRPGERRSLMRRALRGLVPDEILYRKRKAFVSRTPALAIRASLAKRQKRSEVSVLGSLGIIDEERLAAAMKKSLSGGEVALVPLLRLLVLESWLCSLISRGAVSSKRPHQAQLSWSSRLDLS